MGQQAAHGIGGKWCSLSASGQVPYAEIMNGRDAGAFGNQCGFTNLQSGWMAALWFVHTQFARVSRSDQSRLHSTRLLLWLVETQRAKSSPRAKLRRHRRATSLLFRVGACQNFGLQPGRVRQVNMLDDPPVYAGRCATQIDQGGVHTIGGSARHQTE